MKDIDTESAEIQEILAAVERGEAVRRALPDGGVLQLERGLPFLLVYRRPPGVEDAGTARLLAGEASYLIASEADGDVGRLVGALAQAGSRAHGAFLVIEIWAAADPHTRRFTVHAPEGPAPETVEALAEALPELDELAHGVDVVVRTGDVRHPPGLPPLITIREGWASEVLILGLEVPPIHRDATTGNLYPRFLRLLRQALSRALRQTVYAFLRVQTTTPITNPLALGTRSVPDALWEIDRELCRIQRGFDLLLLTSPANEPEARERFRDSGYSENPSFHYRLLPIDPDLLKRRLYDIAIEAVDDPALAHLFEDKRHELDTQLTMLRERGTPAFRYSSYRLYGTVSERLQEVAQEILRTVDGSGEGRDERVDAMTFRDAAEEELAFYRARHPALSTEIQLRTDVAGLMVSRGDLLIGHRLRLKPERVSPLLHHEVGTHVLTYVNGRAQPMELLSLGLADYDELQEGLAVLAEYLVGGLDRSRMRLLAARVLAARSVEQGCDFVETFRMLTQEHGYSRSGAWDIAVRTHTCGGYTRDMIYLRGLLDLLEYLRTGGDLRQLYIGKIAQKHVRLIDELRQRGVLKQPPLLPRFLDDEAANERLRTVESGITLTEMICPEPG